MPVRTPDFSCSYPWKSPGSPWPKFVHSTILGLAFAAALPVHGADDTIVTDRPDFVESSDTVGEGRFQIETSVAFERDHAGGITDHTLTTPTLLRYGVSQNWELRMETDGYTRVRETLGGGREATREQGFSDVALGAKWHMWDGDATTGAPSVGWLFHLDIPSGSSQFEGSTKIPSLRMVAEWELPHEFSLGVMPGVLWDRNDKGERFAAGILGVVFGHSWTENFRTFVEWAGQRLASSGDGGSIITYDLGAAYLLSKNVQIDTAASFGANNYSPDFSWTVGLSVKY